VFDGWLKVYQEIQDEDKKADGDGYAMCACRRSMKTIR